MKLLYSFIIPIFFLLAPTNLLANNSLHHVNFTTEELKNIQGHFSTVYGYLYIRVRGKQVNTHFDGKYIQLVKKSNGHFYPRYKFLWVFPISIGNMSFTLKKSHRGKIQVVMHEKNKHSIVAQKFKVKPVPATWKKRLGTYKVIRLKGNTEIKKVRLAMLNGTLVSYTNNHVSPYPLFAKSNTQLISPSAGHNNERSIKISIKKHFIILEFENNKFRLIK